MSAPAEMVHEAMEVLGCEKTPVDDRWWGRWWQVGVPKCRRMGHSEQWTERGCGDAAAVTDAIYASTLHAAADFLALSVEKYNSYDIASPVICILQSSSSLRRLAEEE